MARKKNPVGDASRPSMDDDPVVKGLLKAISLKRIKPGTKLVADQLVEAFGSNRIHIRQVFEHLGSRNIIQMYPNRGAYVAQPTVEEARQIFATRRILERAAVLELIDRLDARAIKVLGEHVDNEHDHTDSDRWSTLTITGEFHGLIAELSGNAVLAKFIDELVLRTSLIIATFESRETDDCSPDAHPDIAARILARDRDGATAAMDAHLRAMEDRLQFDTPPEVTQDLASIFADIGVARRGRGRKAAE
ncbi:MAG: GntR family transcriptional regulator [Devosia sp.]|nr:GntR family transcriptional regulator [Devosia sp.]